MLNYCNIAFDPIGHTYTTADGEAREGITGMLHRQLFPDMYSGVDEQTLDKAAQRGTDIHTAVEFADEFGADSDRPEVVNYQQILKEHSLDPCESEYLVTDGKHFASAIDKIFKVDDANYILGDIKTTSVLNKEYVRWQLSIYATMFEQLNPYCNATKLVAIWLRGDKAKLVEVERIPNEIVNELLQCEIDGKQFSNPLAPTTATLPDEYRKAELQIIDIEKQMAELKLQREALLSGLKAEMEKAGVKKWETDSLRLTYIEPTTKTAFDSAKFKAEHPDIYQGYLKTTQIKSSIRITTL